MPPDVYRLPLDLTPPIELSDHELCLLLKEVAREKGLPRRDFCSAGAKAVGTHVESAFPDPGRLRTVLQRGTRRGLKEEQRKFLLEVLITYVVGRLDVSPQHLKDLLAKIASGEVMGGSSRADGSIFQGILTPPFKTLPSQRAMWELSGHYLLLRKLYQSSEIITSHLIITHREEERRPLEFETFAKRGPTAGSEKVHVSGVFYAPEFSHEPMENNFFAIGRANSDDELRMSIVRRKVKPSDPDGEMPRDLAGVRLAVGARDRYPRGYRIWAARLKGSYADSEAVGAMRSKYVREFSVKEPREAAETMAVLAEIVDGIEYIKRWLDVEHAVFWHPDDPAAV
jgi:hypothetical protein